MNAVSHEQERGCKRYAVMRKGRVLNMKKLLAMSMAVMMMLGVTSVSAAEDGDTKTTGTTDTESNQSGEMWATLSGEPLKQMKVTVPIRMDFAVYHNEGDADGTNTFAAGNYKIKVETDSEVGVQLTKIQIQNAEGGAWTLVDSTDIGTATTNKTDVASMKTVALNIAGTEMKYGAGETITDFTVGVGAEKSLNVKGTPTSAKLAGTGDAATALNGTAERAFDVVYTIKQVK